MYTYVHIYMYRCELVVILYMHRMYTCILAYSLSLSSAALYNTEGTRIAKSTGMDLVLQSNFDILINGFKYRVEVPTDCKYNGLTVHTTLCHTSSCFHCWML